MLCEYFLAQYPEGKRNADFGDSDAGYSFSQFKNELEEAPGSQSVVKVGYASRGSTGRQD
jgi:hypothetical protein